MKFSGTKAAKLLPLLLCGGVLALLLPYAGRPLWFDEALTVLQFAVLPSAGAIYHSYVIPNNQIIHTIFIHGLLGIAPEGFSLVFWLRMLPVFAAVLTVLILFFRFRRICGAWAISAVLAAWIVSAPFVVLHFLFEQGLKAELQVTPFVHFHIVYFLTTGYYLTLFLKAQHLHLQLKRVFLIRDLHLKQIAFVFYSFLQAGQQFFLQETLKERKTLPKQ